MSYYCVLKNSERRGRGFRIYEDEFCNCWRATEYYKYV